jgi:hypothetical protein
MHPVDINDERARRARRAQRKLDNAIRDAGIHATTAEFLDLEQLARNVRAGLMPIEHAHDLVAALRRQQQSRNAA